jgi:hypothetical protein
MSSLQAVVLLICMLVIFWAAYNFFIVLPAEMSKPMVVATTPIVATVKKEHLDPGYNPKYDRNFHTSVLDREMDKMRDQYGYTADDYALGKLLYKNHSNGG